MIAKVKITHANDISDVVRIIYYEVIDNSVYTIMMTGTDVGLMLTDAHAQAARQHKEKQARQLGLPF